MPKYFVTAERTFTIDYGIPVEADSEEHARILVEQLNEDLDEWESRDECCIEHWHNFDERTPHVFEIREIKEQ